MFTVTVYDPDPNMDTYKVYIPYQKHLFKLVYMLQGNGKNFTVMDEVGEFKIASDLGYSDKSFTCWKKQPRDLKER
jgi:hypothetical protein